MKTSHIFLIQAIYYFVTGLWPVMDIVSFMNVTGPKTDIWLVKMVGMLTVVIAVTLFSTYRKFNTTVITLSVCSATSYIIIDVYYYFNGTISFVYLVDAILEALIIGSVLFNRK